MLHQDLSHPADSAEDLAWVERTLVASIAIMRRSRREIARLRRRGEPARDAAA